MSKQLTDQELEALFQKYLPTDEMPAAMAQRIENQVLYEVGLSLRSERRGTAASTRSQSWLDRLFDSIPKLRIGPSLALASASVVAMLLLVTYGADLASRLNDAGTGPDTGSAVIQDMPTPATDEGSVETVPTDEAVAEAVETDTPVPTDTSEPVAEESAAPSTTMPVEETGSEENSDTGTSETIDPENTNSENTEAPARGGDAPVQDGSANGGPTDVETVAVEDTTEPTAATQEAGAGTNSAGPAPVPAQTSTKTDNINSSPATMPSADTPISSGRGTTPTPSVSSTVRVTNTPTPSAQTVAQLRPTTTPTPTSRDADAVPSPTRRQQLSNTATPTPTNRNADAVPSPTRRQQSSNTTTPTPTAAPTEIVQITSTTEISSSPIKAPQTTSTPIAMATKMATPTATHTPNADSPITITPEPTNTVVLIDNKPPVAGLDSKTLLEEGLARIAVLANDSDPDNDQLFLISVGAAQNGTASIVGGSQIEYTPVKDYYGEDSFTYTVSDGLIESTGIVRLTIRAVNDAPIANDDTVDANEDVVVRFNVLSNDTDVDQDTLSILSFDQALHGIVAVEGNEFVYKPTLNYNGADSFTYVLTDGNAETTARVNIQIAAVNDAPSVLMDNASVTEDGSASISVLANDRDAEGDSLKVASATSPRNGAVSVAADGLTILYTPDDDFNGADEFGYTATDGSLTNSGIVKVSVTPVNDSPVAAPDTSSTNEDTSVVVNVRGNDIDVDGDTLSITSFGQGANGTVATSGEGLRYTPGENFSGSDQFEYTISDGQLSSSAIVVVNVSSNDVPVAENDSAGVAEDDSVVIAVLDNDSDAEGQPLSVTNVGLAQNGVAVLEGSVIRYTPNKDYNGPDQFTYTLSDGVSSATGTVSLTVIPVNDSPVVADVAADVNEDEQVSILLLTNDSDVDGDTLTLTAVQPAHGTVTVNGRSVIYKPEPDYNGADSFEYTASDGVDSVSAKVTVTVQPVNDPPVALGETSEVNEDGEVTISLLDNYSDADGDSLTLTVGQPTHGAIVVNGTNVVYKPTADYNGPDSFDYTVFDGVTTRGAKVMITVIAVNDEPTALPDTASTAEDTPVSIAVLANDSDKDSTLQVSIVSGPANGTATVVGTDVRYQPVPDFFGQDSFKYQIKESNGQGTAQETVTIIVTPVNDAPVANDDSSSTKAGEAIAIEVLSNDTDVDSDSLSILTANQSANGSTVISNSLVIYTPNPGFAGMDSFTYIASDGSLQAEAKVTIEVRNAAPIAQDDSATTNQGEAVVISALSNDTDLDGNALTIVRVGQSTSVGQSANGGTVVTNGSVITYTPSADFASGVDSFTYTVSDGIVTNTATVNVTVNAQTAP